MRENNFIILKGAHTIQKGVLLINENLSETIEYNFPTTPIKASYAAVSDFANGVTPAHWHPELECIVILSGSMNYYVNNNTYLLRKGDGIIINTNRIHLSSSADNESDHLYSNNITITEENDAEFLVLLLHPDSLRFNHKMEAKYINPLLFDSNSDVFFLSADIPWQAESISVLSDIFYAVMEKVPCFELIAQSKFFQLWNLLYQNTIAKNGYELIETDPMNPLKNMISFIQEHYQERITLKDISESGMMCQSKCCRLFRDALRQSPVEYLQNYRIRKGTYLLDHTDMSITEIALECGFHGASYFTETFRKITGITPKEYRKQNR